VHGVRLGNNKTTSTIAAASASKDYLLEVQKILARLDHQVVDRMIDVIWNGYENGRTLFLFGNGGSAALASHFAGLGPIEASGFPFEAQEPFDVIVNATSTSTHGQPLRLPEGIADASTFVYDMAYGPAARAFLEHAQSHGARASDGLGMLVEQAAESYRLWRGQRPPTREVLAELRARAS